MPNVPLDLAEIEQRIAAVRENITELVEQAAAYSGAADEELASRRIAEQEFDEAAAHLRTFGVGGAHRRRRRRGLVGIDYGGFGERRGVDR